MPDTKAVADPLPAVTSISPDGLHNGDIPAATKPFSTITIVADVDNIPSGLPDMWIGQWQVIPGFPEIFIPDELMSFDNVAVGAYQVSGDLKYFPYYTGDFFVALRWGTSAPTRDLSKPIKVPGGMVDFLITVERKKPLKEKPRA